MGGGHSSRMSVDVTTRILATVVQKTTQECIIASSGTNILNLGGSYNTIDGLTQTISFKVDPTCSAFTEQKSKFQSEIMTGLQQGLKDEEVALTQWLDNSSDDQSASIRNEVEGNFRQDTAQSCVNTLTALNVLNVGGNHNTARNVAQATSISAITTCLLGNAQTSDMIANVTNTVNQQSEYTSKNPMAFLTDALTAMFKSVAVVAAILFIVIISFVLIYKYMRHGQDGQDEPAAAPGEGAKLLRA